MRAVFAIAGVTFKEAFRSRFIGFLTIFALMIVASSSVFSYFSMHEQMKLIKDIGLAGITVFSLLICIVLAAYPVPAEFEQKTICNIRTNRITPHDYIWGRFLGIAVFVFFVIFILTIVFFVSIGLKLIVGDAFDSAAGIGNVQNMRWNVDGKILESFMLLKAVVMIYARALVFTSVVLFFSTFTSVSLNFALSLIIYVTGHLTYILAEISKQFEFPVRIVMMIFYFLFPNFEQFNISDAMAVGKNISFHYLGVAIVYGFCYIAAILILAGLLFDRKEV
ncbi:MAG: hypothetical protein P9M03_04020 [Candidatus Theseobacter exili]|nr:hypothetical protein [Candidatus Theseobacter exili]